MVEGVLRFGGTSVRLLLDPTITVQGEMIAALERGIGYEPETAQLLTGVLRPGDGFVDVGAHVGYFSSLAAALVGPEGRVWSFEPNRGNYEGLLRNIGHNGFGHVRPMHMAVGSRAGVVTLHANHDNDGGHALWDPRLHPANDATRASGGGEARVWMTTLDDELGELPPGRIRAMKVDVEGAEVGVLRGAMRMLERQRPEIVLLEVNRFGLQAMGSREQEMYTMMDRLGYELFALIPERNEVLPIAPGQMVQAQYVFNLLCRIRRSESLRCSPMLTSQRAPVG